jgi:hypothetical protein
MNTRGVAETPKACLSTVKTILKTTLSDRLLNANKQAIRLEP